MAVSGDCAFDLGVKVTRSWGWDHRSIKTSFIVGGGKGDTPEWVLRAGSLGHEERPFRHPNSQHLEPELPPCRFVRKHISVGEATHCRILLWHRLMQLSLVKRTLLFPTPLLKLFNLSSSSDSNTAYLVTPPISFFVWFLKIYV